MQVHIVKIVNQLPCGAVTDLLGLITISALIPRSITVQWPVLYQAGQLYNWQGFSQNRPLNGGELNTMVDITIIRLDFKK